jgi:hypothetical protein
VAGTGSVFHTTPWSRVRFHPGFQNISPTCAPLSALWHGSGDPNRP